MFSADVNFNLYYTLNTDSDEDESGSVAYIRIDQLIGEVHDFSTSSNSVASPAETATTHITPSSSPEQEVRQRLSSTESASVSPTPSPPTTVTTSPTSSSSMFAIRSSSTLTRSFTSSPLPLQTNSSAAAVNGTEGITLTELVEIHAIPRHIDGDRSFVSNNNNNDADHEHDAADADDAKDCGKQTFTIEAAIDANNFNNNTSCSLSSTLTDSKTIDVRTPIVV